VPTVLDTVFDVSRRIDTVVSVGASTRCEEHGEDPQLAPTLAGLGYSLERAKTNMGLGRVTNIPSDEEVSDEHTAPVR